MDFVFSKFENISLERLNHRLFVERWNNQSNFTNYFHQCQPLKYQYTINHDESNRTLWRFNFDHLFHSWPMFTCLSMVDINQMIFLIDLKRSQTFSRYMMFIFDKDLKLIILSEAHLKDYLLLPLMNKSW